MRFWIELDDTVKLDPTWNQTGVLAEQAGVIANGWIQVSASGRRLQEYDHAITH
jgi:hypothetical protein